MLSYRASNRLEDLRCKIVVYSDCASSSDGNVDGSFEEDLVSTRAIR